MRRSSATPIAASPTTDECRVRQRLPSTGSWERAARFNLRMMPNIGAGVRLLNYGRGSSHFPAKKA
jgi:hypothetical protein